MCIGNLNLKLPQIKHHQLKWETIFNENFLLVQSQLLAYTSELKAKANLCHECGL